MKTNQIRYKKSLPSTRNRHQKRVLPHETARPAGDAVVPSWTFSIWFPYSPQHRICPTQGDQRHSPLCWLWFPLNSHSPWPNSRIWHDQPFHPHQPPPVFHWHNRYCRQSWRPSGFCSWSPSIHHLHPPNWTNPPSTPTPVPLLCWWHTALPLNKINFSNHTLPAQHLPHWH